MIEITSAHTILTVCTYRQANYATDDDDGDAQYAPRVQRYWHAANVIVGVAGVAVGVKWVVAVVVVEVQIGVELSLWLVNEELAGARGMEIEAFVGWLWSRGFVGWYLWWSSSANQIQNPGNNENIGVFSW